MKNRLNLTFSLRTTFILLTTGCVWLAWKCEQARTQREVVKAIEALGGSVGYDWQDVPLDPADPFNFDGPLTPPGPVWLRRLIGNEFFQEAVYADFSKESSALKSVVHLKRLRKLKTVVISPFASNATMDELKAALPNCEVEMIVF